MGFFRRKAATPTSRKTNKNDTVTVHVVSSIVVSRVEIAPLKGEFKPRKIRIETLLTPPSRTGMLNKSLPKEVSRSVSL